MIELKEGDTFVVVHNDDSRVDFIRDNPYNLECLNGELCTDVSLIYEACKQFPSIKKAKYIKFSPKYINAIKTREQD